MEKGLLMVFTGDGKGKTTAALGMAMRSAGHGFRVCVVQFIKGSWKYGELEAVKRFGAEIDFRVMGRGFTFKSDDIEKDRALAHEAWEYAQLAMFSREYHLIILDEFTYLLNYGMVGQTEFLDVMAQKPENLHIAVTGRSAPHAVIKAADLVTEMREIKHPFKEQGILAQKGIEF
ncbi:MAG: cob(I)yrinic acid a,c-diamide adenosyltransferase [Desulfobacterales bacterium]|nr:cob(I)yrinic acid a,c-diamide adenosyltransferase [Desulfobacterales bacterium]